jgi:prepilin-type N-terminal cleavage/methylation domain-containing protein
MKRLSRGFTIVELMIAMVIFMIICAIAIPNYVSALQRTHEAVAVSFLRQVQTSEEAYRLSSDKYADTFAKLQPYMSVELLPPALPTPGLGGGPVTIAYAEPLPGGPPQGKSGSAPGQTGSTPGQSGTTPGQSGSAPGQGGSSPGQSGSAPGQTGSTPGQSGSSGGQGSGGSASSGSASSGTTTPPTDTMVYSKYIFELTLTDTMHWSCTAQPVGDRLNSKFFYTDQTNIIHLAVGSLADNLSPQL